MKTQILPFLLGIFVAISFAATTSNLLTVKPATPKSVIVIGGNDDPYEVETEIRRYVREGYIVKTACVSSRHYDAYSLIVMEKY